MDKQLQPKLSKSAVLCYDSCPYQYKLRYIMKMKPLPSPIMERGSQLHKLCEIFFEGTGTILEGVEKILKDENAIEHKAPMRNFIQFVKHISQGKFRKPLMQENKFFLEKYNFTVIADAIFEDDEGNLMILDYKSGRNRGVKNYRFELATYTFTMEEILGRKIKYWGILFLDDNEFVVDKKATTRTFDYEEVIPNEIKKAKLKINNTRMKINLQQFPKKPKYGCFGNGWSCGFFGNGCDGV